MLASVMHEDFFRDIEAIKSAGFGGFVSVSQLQKTRCSGVPSEAGVYLVLRVDQTPPQFPTTNSGGRFKGRDPTVDVAELAAKYVDGAAVIYIGKAGGGSSRNDLKKRLWSFMLFGAGEPVGHWGGRYIWQIEGSAEHVVCWRSSGDLDAAELESFLIAEFARRYGRRPFANLRD